MIVVTGTPRSGTSLTAALLYSAGARILPGTVQIPSASDPVAGYMEGGPLRRVIIQDILENNGFDPRGQFNVPPIGFNPDYPFRTALVSFGPTEDLMIKEAKLILFWRTIDDHFPEAKWVIVRRSLPDIVDSCIRMGWMKNKDPDWVTRWVLKYVDRIEEFKRHRVYREIWPEQYINGDDLALQEIVAWLGLPKDPDLSLIDKKLWH